MLWGDELLFSTFMHECFDFWGKKLGGRAPPPPPSSSPYYGPDLVYHHHHHHHHHCHCHQHLHLCPNVLLYPALLWCSIIDNKIHTLPLPPFKVGGFVFVLQEALKHWHNIAWRGGGGKTLFPLFKFYERPFEAQCLNYSGTPPYDHPFIWLPRCYDHILSTQTKITESFYYFENPFNSTTSLLRQGFYGLTVVV